MISFLQSIFLYGLIGVSLPFLIHFLNRRKPKKIAFSTLFFLKQLQQKKMRRLKIRQLLLLLLRALIIAAFVMAFSRPTMKTGQFILGKATVRTAAAIVLDNSMSMRLEDAQGTRYSRALNGIRQLVQQFRPGDQIYLFLSCPTSEYPEPQVFESRESVLKILEHSSASQQYGNLMGVMSEAVAKLQESVFPNKELYIFSDFQANSWQLQPDDKNRFAKAGVRAFLLDFGNDRDENIGIQNVQLENQMIELGKTVTVSTAVKNYSGQDVNDLLVHAFLQGKRVGQNSLSLAAKRSQQLDFNLLIKESGFISGFVEIEDDPLIADNRGYFNFYLHDKIKILLVGDAADLNYLQLALSPDNDPQQLFEFEKRKELQHLSLPLSQYTIVVLADPDRVSTSDVSSLSQYVDSGGQLIFFPGSRMDLRQLNKNMFQEMGLPVLRETRGLIGKSSSYAQWGSINFKHPIFSGIFREKVENIDSPRFFFRIFLDAAATKGTDIIKFKDGSPFLYSIQKKNGTIFLFTSALDPQWNDFIYKPIFPPLMYRSMIFLASKSQQNTSSLKVSDVLAANIFEPDADYILVRPDGVEEKMIPKHAGASMQIECAQAKSPGIYMLRKDGQLFKQWVVNIDPRESAMERIPIQDVKEMFNDQAFELSLNTNYSDQIEKYRFGNEITRWFFILALVFMSIEMLVGREDLLQSIPWLKKYFKEVDST